jgi:hypothetical protein
MCLKFIATIVLSLLLFSSLAPAIDKSPPPGLHSRIAFQPSTLGGPAYTGRAYFEGFEGTFPPTGWTLGTFHATLNWFQNDLNVVEGSYSAQVEWDSFNPSNETLSFDQYVDVAGGEYVLSFWMAGSVGQWWDLNVAETVEINGVTVFDFDSSVTVEYMRMEQFFIDLSDYDGTTVTITFRYEGIDGDVHFIDAVMVDDGTGYEVPPISFCELAEEAWGTGSFTGDTCGGLNLISMMSCDNWVYFDNGLEDYYEVVVSPGGSFTATVTHSSDGTLWILGECIAEVGRFTCLGHADATGAGEPEVISYTNDTDSEQLVYLIVDSWDVDTCGSYDMYFDGLGAIANEVMSFGAVKAMYR